jgi:hypothetical protein
MKQHVQSCVRVLNKVSLLPMRPVVSPCVLLCDLVHCVAHLLSSFGALYKHKNDLLAVPSSGSRGVVLLQVQAAEHACAVLRQA